MSKKITTQILLLLAFLSMPLISYAQTDGVGIGTNDVDAHAILDIVSTDKGVLIPNVENPNKVDDSPTESMLIYNDRDHRFSYYGKYNGSTYQWMDLNPWLTNDVKSGGAEYATIPYKVGVNMNREPNAELEVVGTIKATEFDGLGTVPLGGIIMWNGNSGTIPDGYALCNGNGGRPDLRGKFILGGTNAGATGGVNTSSSNSIQYKHVNEYTTSKPGCSSIQYLYSGKLKKVSGNFGPVNITFNNEESTCPQVAARFGDNTANPPIVYDVETCNQSNNPSYYIGNSSCRTDGYRSQELITSTENRPAYYVLAFIMRVD